MEEFSGATAESIQQEFYINMLLSNLASLINNEADEELSLIHISKFYASIILLKSSKSISFHHSNLLQYIYG